MDDKTRDRARKRFYGHKRLKSKYRPKYPSSAEREYVRLVNSYMGILKKEIEKSLPELKKTYIQELKENDEYRQNYRTDSATGLMLAVEKLFQQIEQTVKNKVQKFDLRNKLRALAKRNRKLTIAELKKAIKATLGLNLAEDAYNGDELETLIEQWVSDNVDLIVTIPQDSLARMKELIYDNFNGNTSGTDLVTAIKNEYSTTDAHAKMIARDQTAKLNGNITKYQQTNAGITKYTWSTSGDERVRACHRDFDGRVFSWDDPPEIYYYHKNGGIVYTGRHCHPGEDYQCRCCAIPVFEEDELDNIPVEEENT